MLTALNVLVGLIIAALGANLFTAASSDASAMERLMRRWGIPTAGHAVRTWSNRFCGAFLIVIGLGLGLGLNALV